MGSHIKLMNTHTLFSPILVSGCKYRDLYHRVVTTTTLTIHTQTFVHDLAGDHFSIGTIALMKENLPFGNNITNPQNVPQARLMENLRGILAQKI